MRTRRWLWTMLATITLVAAGCVEVDGNGADEGELLDQGGNLDENGKPTLGQTEGGKGDNVRGQRGLPTSVDDAPTAVWEVRNRWDESDTPEAREAGMAWPADSGMTWEEKYRAWVGSLRKTDGESYGETFMMQTPYGKEVPAPSLECAEAAIFLRVTFAAWYGLPYFMEARDRHGNRLYFGHFGIRTADGRWKNMPNFRRAYDDYSDRADRIRTGDAEWPSDPELASRTIPGAQDDEQPMIGPDAHAGAYFDEIYLNKRVGYFMRLQLTYFGSINLADPVNMFNLEPTAIDSGDILVERWQQSGIGHTLIVMRSRRVGTATIDDRQVPQYEAELASGSMPRRQPRWNEPAASKRSLTLAKAGGPGYVDYGGGIKRWRSTREVNGRWTNVVPDNARDAYIDSTDDARLKERPQQFDEILTELSPEQKLESLADLVEAKREHLRENPSSCAARISREEAFDEMYDVGEELGMTKADVDRQYRKFEDYVFAELKYDRSKTCCWLASTPEMYELIIEYNLNRAEDPETRQCREVAVFKNRDDGGDGYERFRSHAESVGRGDAWVDWSAGESCPQRDVAADTEADHDWTPLCGVYDALDMPGQ